MNFTNSPYERMMKEVPHYKSPPCRMPRKDRLVRGVLIGEGSPVFSATGSTSKSRADMLAFALNDARFARGSDHILDGSNMISLSILDSLKYC